MVNMFDSLSDLCEYMDLEPAEEQNLPAPAMRKRAGRDLEVSHAALPNGKQIALLKTLLTSACERDCNYCPFRAGRDFRRATLRPDEMAQAFMAMTRAGIVEGLFLSSGILKGGVYTQDQLIDTAEILRHKFGFKGYLHLKIMPGCEYDQVKRAMQLADRVSVNLEAPNEERLTGLAPHKNFFDELFRSLKWIHHIRTHYEPDSAIKGHWPSMTTQFVVGAVGESDLGASGHNRQASARNEFEPSLFLSFSSDSGYTAGEQPGDPSTPPTSALPGFVSAARLWI